MPIWEARGRIIVAGSADDPVAAARIMGIVNVTPDSFSDGGRWVDAASALAHARTLADEGAHLLDVGGESSRPGSEPVPLDEELRRVIPTVESIAAELPLPISVDTTKALVARQALAAGASIINDITALRGDPELADVVAEAGAGLVLMHMQGEPRSMQANPTYVDVVQEVYDFLEERVAFAESTGIPRSRIAIDPGVGFGKTLEHNLLLLRNLGRFASLGCAVLIGTSRKRFLGTITGRPVERRATASAVSALHAATLGAAVVRVHDVAATADAFHVWSAQQQGAWNEEPGHP